MERKATMKRWQAFAAAAIPALGWFALCALLYGIRYEVNDDAIISNIAAGAYGGATQYLVYPNLLLGLLLKPLYWLVPTLNWFVVVLVAAGLVCFTYLGSVLLRRLGLLWGGIAYAALLVLAGTELFVRFHYVRYAAVLLATGLLLLGRHLGRWNLGTLAGALLVLLGSLVRFQQLAATGGVALAWLLYCFVRLPRPARLRALACGGITLAVVLACFGVDALAYRSSDGWAAYTRYNAARMEVSDYRLNLVGDAEEAAQYGLTATDYELLDSWTFYDTERFGTEQLEQLADTLPTGSLGSAAKATAKAALQALYLRPVNLLLAAVLLLWLIFSGKRKWVPFLGTLLGFGAMLFYLAWRVRLLERIDYGLVFAAMLFCAASFVPQGQGRPARGIAAVAAVLMVASLPSLVAQYQGTADYWESRRLRENQVDALIRGNDGSRLYLLDSDLIDAANGFTVWRAKPQGYFENTVFLGSWLMHSPFESATLEAWGVENPYRDATGRSDVLVADYYRRALKEDYIQAHYSPTAQLELAEEWGSFNLYQVTE